jgi:RNA polymerase sigma-70 factor (ECF subfamily)
MLGQFSWGESRPWLLTLVRWTCYTWLQHNCAQEPVPAFDDERQSIASAEAHPETLRLHRGDAQARRRALEILPVVFREVII